MSYVVKYSIVIPVFNSEESLVELHSRLVKLFESIDETFEIIFVDDCSSDNSWKVLEDLHDKDKRVKIIQLMKNFGQDNAVMCGFKHVNGERIITMDDDLQHPPEEIPKLIDKAKEGYDVVYGRFRKKKHFWFRNLASILVDKFIIKIIGFGFNTSFRLIDRKVIAEVIKFHNYNVIIDVLFANVISNKKIGACRVKHDNRKYGKTTYSFRKLCRVALNIIFNNTILPLRLATIIGLFFSGVSAILAIYYFLQYYFSNITISGFTSLILSITFFSGLILFILGIIGEYLGRVFLILNKKPQYTIKQDKL